MGVKMRTYTVELTDVEAAAVATNGSGIELDNAWRSFRFAVKSQRPRPVTTGMRVKRIRGSGSRTPGLVIAQTEDRVYSWVEWDGRGMPIPVPTEYLRAEVD